MRVARLWRTRNPSTFNDKVRYKLLRDHRPLMVTFADKAAMRAHVAALVGERYLPALLGLATQPADLCDLHLPDEFVMKPTHGSGACVVVSRRAPAESRPPEPGSAWTYSHVRPEHCDGRSLEAIADEWLKESYGRGPNHEWAYGRARRQVMIEELLSDSDGAIPADYKLFVFHQQCRFVQVDGARFGSRTQDFFDRDWAALSLTGGHPRSPTPPGRPARLTEMIELAERLGAGTDFVRVDLFCLAERVVVGELTSSPAGGDSPFEPERWNMEFGRTWKVPRRYR